MRSPAGGKPRLVVIAPERLFLSFFDAGARRRLGRSFRWSRHSGRRLTGALRTAVSDADALVTTWDGPRFGEDVLQIAPRLRVIGHCGGEVKGRFAGPLFSALTITNAPAPMARPVAELAVTLLLHGVRGIDRYREELRRGSRAVYGRLHREGASDRETLEERTVGLLGFGKIGRTIAEMLAPFGPRLLVHDPYVPAAAIRRAGATPASWLQLLRAPTLVLAAALTERTRGILDAAALARLPDGALVVNVARGGLLDLEALTREVRRGRLRCALDVTDPDEPLPPRHPLRRARGAVLTPHVGAAQRTVRRRMAALVMDDLERFFAGRPVRSRVTTSMLRRMT